MTRTGKIARLPHKIRHQLNLRLRDGAKHKSILDWLNSLPETQALLEAEFDGRPITPSNLSEWMNGGYPNWEIQQNAIDFACSLDDVKTLDKKNSAASFAEKLAHWLALYYAGIVRATMTETNPELRWARLRELCADVTRLRRGELFAQRISLERERLALEHSKAQQKTEEEFWKWTEREDIRAKLYPEGEGLSPETLEKIERELRLM